MIVTPYALVHPNEAFREDATTRQYLCSCTSLQSPACLRKLRGVANWEFQKNAIGAPSTPYLSFEECYLCRLDLKSRCRSGPPACSSQERARTELEGMSSNRQHCSYVPSRSELLLLVNVMRYWNPWFIIPIMCGAELYRKHYTVSMPSNATSQTRKFANRCDGYMVPGKCVPPALGPGKRKIWEAIGVSPSMWCDVIVLQLTHLYFNANNVCGRHEL